ncbi:MAG: HEAT repeat domain-containing protein [Gemmataceae bacterium]
MRIVAVLLLITASPAALRADEDRAAALVRQLGNPSFRVREEAGKRLVELGRAAFPALQAGLDDREPEVRYRCKQILPAIFDLEMKARLDAFLADPDSDGDHALPGWQRFRKLVGGTPADRILFGRIARADLRLLEAVENRPRQSAAERLAGRCSQIQMQLQSPALSLRGGVQLADIAELLFLGTNPDVTLTPQAIQLVNALTYQPVFQHGLQAGDHAAAVKKLLLAWIDRNVDDPNTCYVIANLLKMTGLPELAQPALRMAANPKLIAYARAAALVALGKTENKGLVPKLEELLMDETLVSNFAWNNIRGQTQIRDVALAMVIHLSGQQPAEFGFETLKSNPSFINSYYYLGFASNSARDAALDKWKAWKKQNEKGK